MRGRLGRVAIGFWLGGVALGMAGCILGACLAYRQPLVLAISVLWWGIYLGCFGASIGALFALWSDRAPGLASRRSDDTSKPPGGLAGGPSS